MRVRRILPGIGALGLLLGCSLLATRPVQEMSDTTAALRAAGEVQADTLAPELYRQAHEWFLRAKQQYKLKNFKDAQAYARRARLYAEQAEFEAIRNGGQYHTEVSVPDTAPPPAETSTPEFPSPTGTPAEPLGPPPSPSPSPG